MFQLDLFFSRSLLFPLGFNLYSSLPLSSFFPLYLQLYTPLCFWVYLDFIFYNVSKTRYYRHQNVFPRLTDTEYCKTIGIEHKIDINNM